MVRSDKLRVFAPTAGDAMDGSSPMVEGRLADGLRVAVDVGAAAHSATQTIGADLYAMIELLIAKGVLHYKELEDRRAQIAAELKRSSVHIEMSYEADKYAIAESEQKIDCEARYPLCHGACCRLTFGLSQQDLDEGILRWEYGRPYRIRHRPEDDRCVHQHPTSLGCTVYENRPAVCRTYSCKEDKRIWLDFEKRIPNPELKP